MFDRTKLEKFLDWLDRKENKIKIGTGVVMITIVLTWLGYLIFVGG